MHDAYNDDSESGVGIAQIWRPSDRRLSMMVRRENIFMDFGMEAMSSRGF